MDEPFYAPNRQPRPAPVPKVGESVWELRKDFVTWACELLSHGEWGWEARILRGGDFAWSHRFPLKAQAVAWAEGERADIEKGWKG